MHSAGSHASIKFGVFYLRQSQLYFVLHDAANFPQNNIEHKVETREYEVNVTEMIRANRLVNTNCIQTRSFTDQIANMS